MSFEPITRWALRCDGTTTRGQCDHRLVDCHPDDDPDSPLTVWAPNLFDQPELTRPDATDLRYRGWLVLRDGRVLCPAHVAGLEHLARAAVDGLPFDEEWAP
jgi:hypothetical protein